VLITPDELELLSTTAPVKLFVSPAATVMVLPGLVDVPVVLKVKVPVPEIAPFRFK
jgi:hypothetical protein